MLNLEDDDRIAPKTKIPELFNLIDKNKKALLDDLRDAVSIPSVSTDPTHFSDVLKMLNFCAEKLEVLGASVDVIDGNNEANSNLPPVLFADLFVDEEYKTICVYGNIDTLSPALTQSDKRPPFELTEELGRLYGCGISDNKAPLLCWFNALKIYKMSKNVIPVNMKFVIEATSELYSQSLFNAMQKKREFFNNVEYICLTIDKMVNEMPCLKYGYRGLCHFALKVSCGNKRVHSGTYGGAFNQPLMDAVNVIGSLVDKQGKVAISEFIKDVKSITEVDYDHCKKEPFCVETLKKETGVMYLEHKEIPSRIMMHKTRLPSFTVNAFHIISAAADKDDCASIPNKIKARFSVRLVPNQTADRTFQQFKRYIDEIWHHYKSANDYDLKMTLGFDPWQEDPSSEHYDAAARAIKTVYKVCPSYISEGSTMPAVSIFNTMCPSSNIIVMPISGHKDGHHTKDESISILNYIQGVKLSIAYMCEIHEINYK
ncbi:cytosolic non-specific dipeptidase-like isoform X1 [Nasonia vitripennis]|uniref:Peptidase M20 dimerisation domain-containing protein n=1 Tax=Nasonia vitripennis TaxID=7425 RepID=A0A7M7HCU2_NASVI|nr:cytosolic non-specific dipeptidase-like isoform X1 [Nasonia vitripennis]